MAASINASPNPVGLWSSSATGTTTITWDTGLAGVNGKVRVSVDGGTPTDFDDPGRRTGTKIYPNVMLGHTYTFTLLRRNNNAILGSVAVTTEDIQQAMIERFVEWGMLEKHLFPSQSIHSVTVVPAVDTVRISFRTIQPTIPSVVVETSDGTQVAAWFPLLGGLQTDHSCNLGLATPLAQDSMHRFRIVASGHTSLGKPHEAVVSGTFVTGHRTATTFFERIKVRKDGDPGLKGAGEFTFTFGAGDADGGAPMGEPWPTWGAGDISDDDPPVDVNRQIVIPNAPRRIWAEVVGSEDDRSLFAGGIGLGQRPTFTVEGTGYTSIPETDQAWVARAFDVGDVIGGVSENAIEMATGDFGVAFTVFGRLRVEAQSGSAFSLRKLRRGAITAVSGLLAAGDVSVVGVGSGHKHMVGVGADATLYHKLVGAGSETPRDEGWARVATGVHGPITALATSDGRCLLFGPDADGVLSYQAVGSSRANGRWQRLGERFPGSIVAAEGAEGRVELFGLTEEGIVMHRSLDPRARSPGQNGWERIGDGVAGSVVAVGSRLGVGVFALGRDGTVLHKRRARNRWSPSGTKWDSLGRMSADRLLGVPLDETGVALAALADDGTLHVLLWRDYPDGDPSRRWKAHGTLDSWLTARTERVSEPAKRIRELASLTLPARRTRRKREAAVGV